MGQLPRNVQAEVESSEASTGFKVAPEGWFEARLDEVDENAMGPKGPYVVWKFKDMTSEDDGITYKGTIFHNTSHAAPGMIKAVLDAFGASSDVDMQTLVGEHARIYLIQEQQQKGKNAGKMQNSLADILPMGYSAGSNDDEPPF
jgi:hypothetical protein